MDRNRPWLRWSNGAATKHLPQRHGDINFTYTLSAERRACPERSRRKGHFNGEGRPQAAFSKNHALLINRLGLESCAAFLRLIGADITGNHGAVIALQREFAI